MLRPQNLILETDIWPSSLLWCEYEKCPFQPVPVKGTACVQKGAYNLSDHLAGETGNKVIVARATLRPGIA